MKKRTLYSIVVSLALFAVMFITCGLIGVTGNKDAYAETSKPETLTFAMRSGASIKYSDPSGIRFTTYVNSDYYNSLVEDEKAFHFGTIYAPATAYSGSIDDFTHASEVENGVSDIKIDKDMYWGADTVNDVEYMTYNTVQLYSESARNNGYYGVKMLAKSYVWIDENGNGLEDAGEYTYVANGVVRSIAQVAASALADGNDSEYIDAIPGYALNAKNLVGSNDTAVTVNGFTYHKDGANSLDSSRNNQDYIYLPSGGTADFSYTPALLHTGDYMTAASDYAVTYGSGNDSVFTVDGGTITAVGAGTASLTAGVGTRVVAPVTTVSVVSPASSTYNRSGLAVTYQFDDVSYYGDSHILTFDADYINGKIAEGYNSVQVTMTIPSNGGSGISVRLYIDDTENKIASADTTDTSVSGTYDLVSDKAYSVVFRQSVDTTLDMTVVLQFNKDVTAYSSGDGIYTDYVANNATLTASATTVNANSETTTYTVNIKNNTYTFLNFNVPFINEKIAAGYTKVAFYIGPWSGYKQTILEGTNLDPITQLFPSGGNPSYGPVALTADSEYRLRFYLGTTTDITVTVTFIKDADVISYCLANGAEFGVSSSTTCDAEGEIITYTFANVTNSEYVYYDFNASYINEKVAEGCETVTFKFEQWGYKAVTLYKNGVLTQSPAAASPAITLTAEDISANDYFRIVLMHNINNNAPANITIKATFDKPVCAYKESNNAKIEFTSTTTKDSSGELMTFTFNSVPNATYNRFYFDENFIAKKMAAGYNKVEFNIYTWGAKVAELYENTTQIGSMSTNGRDPFTCGEIALTENAYYYIRLYHNVGSAPADITVTVRFTTPEQQAFNILATASSYGNHYHGTFGGVSSSGNSVSVVAGKGAGSDYRGFTLTPAAIQAMYNLGFSAVTFTVNSPTGYIDLYNMADAANCVIGTRANIIGGNNYFANGTITLNLANLVNDATAMASEGVKFVVTNDASWTVYATNCTVTFSDITFTPV